MKLSAKQIATGGLILAVCIASQFLKNFSPYITGSIINLALLLATTIAGIPVAVIIGIITPVTSFFISGSPAFPLFLPGIMLGNATIVIIYGLLAFKKPGKVRMIIALAAGTICKALVMGLLFINVFIPTVAGKLPAEKVGPMTKTLQFNFSVLQLITAAIGSVLMFLIYSAVKGIKKNDN